MHATGLDRSPEGRLVVTLGAVLRRLRQTVDSGPVEPAALLVLHQAACAGMPRVSELAGPLGLDTSTVSRHVSHLTDAGYLERRPDPDDRRAARLVLSAQGRTVLDEAHAHRAAAIRRALQHWDQSDRDHLLELVERLATDLDAAFDTCTAASTPVLENR